MTPASRGPLSARVFTVPRETFEDAVAAVPYAWHWLVLGACYLASKQTPTGTLPADPALLVPLLRVRPEDAEAALAAVQLVFTMAVDGGRIGCPWLMASNAAADARSASAAARRVGKRGGNQHTARADRNPDASPEQPRPFSDATPVAIPAAHPLPDRFQSATPVAEAPPESATGVATEKQSSSRPVAPEKRERSTPPTPPPPHLSARAQEGRGLGGGEPSPPLGGGEGPRSPTPSGSRVAPVRWPEADASREEAAPERPDGPGRLFAWVPPPAGARPTSTRPAP